MGDTFFWIALGVVLAVVLAILIIRRVRHGIHAVQGAAKAESYRPSRDRVRVGKRPAPAVPKKTVKPKPVFRGPLGPALIAFGFDDPAGFITLFTCQPMRAGSLEALRRSLALFPISGFLSPGSSAQPPGSATGERTRTGPILNSPIRQKRPRNRETQCLRNTLLTR